MHRLAFYGILFLASVVLQSTLFHFFKICGVKPDLILLIVIISSFFRGEKFGAALGFVYGIFEDLIVGRYIGIQALTKMATGYAVGILGKKLFHDNLISPTIAAFIGSLIHGFLYIIVLFCLGFYSNPFRSFFPVINVAFYNMLITLAVFLVQLYSSKRKLFRTLGR
ncbi:MAG TPA: rod shape-determining protein MreD [Peptococcaceae bacterium]|nr:MAG: Rod shape-determining protein MreD [Clostridia bacterium 41_269]HBT20406.1 rod shape-determining protein MreD [Peptococcaceae bacterium]